MDKYQNMNHSRLGVPPAVPPPHAAPNKFIYVKQDFFRVEPEKPAVKVLVNPHFKKNSTIYVNPKFSAIRSEDAAVKSAPNTQIHVNPAHVNLGIKPKIHVNPNILKSRPPMPNKKPDRIISTRTKFIRVPSETPRRRTSSLHTKYKIVRSSNKENSLKVDKRTSPTNKRKYVYINRFLSMSVMAKSVVLKQNPSLKRKGFVNINGIMYKKSPNSLKKEVPMNSSISKYRYVKKLSVSSSSKVKTPLKPSEGRRSLVKRFKVVRSKKTTKDRKLLHKCNIPCQIYRKYGKCKGKSNGTCFKVHNPDQIVLCTKFLQGACLNKNCLLSHKVSHEKMPACKYYLEGMCSREDCPYLHVKISVKADICRDFITGYCKKAAECDKRHQFLCPDFERNQTCPKRRCPYPHGTVRSSKVQFQVAKKCSSVKKKPPVKNTSNTKSSDTSKSETKPVTTNSNRYYDDDQKSQPKLDSDLKVAVGRPKLGTLPSFIPLFEDT